MKDITQQSAIELGERIAALLNINPVGRQRYKTSLGIRESEGLGRIISTIHDDVQRKSNKINKGA
jgi:hypothetical protein